MTVREWTLKILKEAFGISDAPPESTMKRVEVCVQDLWDEAYADGELGDE